MLRNKETDTVLFREVLEEMGTLIGYHILDAFPYVKVRVETPLNAIAEGISIPGKNNVVLIGVLRAALPLLQGLLKVFPNAKIGLVGAVRLESEGMKNYSFEVDISYFNIPDVNERNIVILADPMIATGSTLAKVIHLLLDKYSLKKLIVVGVVATPVGLKRIEDELVDTEVYVAAIDKELNEKGYIIPGLGDAGDRVFGVS